MEEDACRFPIGTSAQVHAATVISESRSESPKNRRCSSDGLDLVSVGVLAGGRALPPGRPRGGLVTHGVPCMG